MTPFKTTWQAPEFPYREKDVSWYWASIIVAVFILAAAVWQRNFLFGFFVVVAEILVLVWGARAPRTVAFVLTEKGLTIEGKKFYPLSDISGFTADEHEGNEWSRVFFTFRRRLAGTLAVVLPTKRIEEIGKYLTAAGIPSVEHEPSFIEILEQFFHF